MSVSVADMQQRAEQARLAAAGETLENVRRKHLEAAVSWQRLADSAEAMLRQRAERDAEAAARQAAAARLSDAF